MKMKSISNIIMKAIMILCSPVLILLFGIIGLTFALLGDDDEF